MFSGEKKPGWKNSSGMDVKGISSVLVVDEAEAGAEREGAKGGAGGDAYLGALGGEKALGHGGSK
jgi:hypothetical protein